MKNKFTDMKTIQYYLSSLLAFVLVVFMTMGANAQDKQLQDFRPYSQEGVNVFSPFGEDPVEFDGKKVYLGGAFAQQFQALSHETDAGQLPDLGSDFNLATANLYLDAQLAEGVRVHVTTYLSSRHHPEAWVKGGYMLADELPMFNSDAIDGLMDYLTIKIGHMEVNYGDAHFRRTDNANAMYNAFVGNYLMDSFTTEVGGEIYFQNNGVLAMLGITNGQLSPSVMNSEYKSPSIYGKLGYDKQLNEMTRVRLTASYYTTSSSAANHLYSGDRAGARYYGVLDGGFRTPRITPGLSNEVSAFQINPFVKYDGLELFGVIETASGNSRFTDANRNPIDQVGPDKSFNQIAVEALYRFLKDDQLYIGGRYNVVNGELETGTGLTDVSADRIQIGAGWYMTPNILLKAEYMTQTYSDYPTGHIYNGASIDGVMVEAAIGF